MSEPTSDRKALLVVQVVRQYAPSRGGLEDVVANLAKALPTHGFRTRVVTCDRLFTDTERKLPARETIDGVEVIRVPWSGSTRYPVAPGVFGHIRDADLVHVHAVDFFFDALAWGWPLHRRPLVATTHGGFFHTKNHAAIKKVWFQTMTRASASAYRALVCCSQSDLDLFNRVAARKTVLIENGVDSLKFASERENVPSKRLVTIGRFSVNKRIDRLLDVMKALTAKDPDWRLDVIGSPSDLGAADMDGLIAERGLGPYVTVHLSPENARIRELLAEASLFVSASEYEGFGLVAVEAMGAGLVPVLHPNEAYRVLVGKHAGLALADFSDPDAAASILQETFETLRNQTGTMRSAMREAAATYSWDGVASKYAELYADVLGGRRS
ncbi:glycosyltransferase family 4 protein [Pseudomonas sp. R2.Fl]|nr:glycosyltransferase family 4 protein [Pseudomonas sp. R2.Fl]